MNDEDVESIVSPLSTSKDGSLKFEKFISLYKSLCKDVGLNSDQEEGPKSHSHLMDAFRVFDQNRDGYIPYEEL